MIDNFAILVSCVVVAYIAWRAALLDTERPWFKSYLGKRRFAAHAEPERPVWRR